MKFCSFEEVCLKGSLEYDYSITRILLNCNRRGSFFRWLKTNYLEIIYAYNQIFLFTVALYSIFVIKFRYWVKYFESKKKYSSLCPFCFSPFVFWEMVLKFHKMFTESIYILGFALFFTLSTILTEGLAGINCHSVSNRNIENKSNLGQGPVTTKVRTSQPSELQRHYRDGRIYCRDMRTWFLQSPSLKLGP